HPGHRSPACRDRPARLRRLAGPDRPVRPRSHGRVSPPADRRVRTRLAARGRARRRHRRALFLAARHPESVTSLVVGGGATAYPLEVTGALADIIAAPDIEAVKSMDIRA